ncbi:MAG: DNA polymerase III subunit delta [Spirochaetales bacterium]|uniref:DNA-directed DNA polymerase n=1 Tax=Candidatus Thalassospirochaeta sargassi TaxID=3119039 RepID=A0AAJ1IEU8_9SPIO|nr:DNA polymerase III subunit delta [Spirochaetales bacterium]
MTDTAWLLSGPEAGERTNFLKQLRNRLTDSFGEEPEQHRFYPFESTVSEIISLIKNGSLFSAWKLIIIGQADLLKKAEIEEIKAYLSNPSEDAVLIFLSDETSLKNGLGKIVPKQNQKIFWEMFENQKKGWLSGFFRNRRIEIEPDAIELLLTLVENNTADMKKECEKLAIFFGEGASISKGEIENFFYHGKEENVFSLFNRIAAADFGGSVEILQKIMLGNETNTVQLLGGLMWQLRNLQGIAVELNKGESFQSACYKNNIRGKKAQAVYSEALKHYSEKNLRDIIALTAEYDIKLRTARQEQREMTAQLYLYSLIIQKGSARIL